MTGFASLPDHTRGMIFIIGSVLMFSLMDAVAKALGAQVDVSQIMWARYTGQLVIILVVFAPRLRAMATTQFPKLQVLRAVFQLVAAGSFFTALKYIGLAEATAIGDTAPVLITLGAAVILREKVGMRRVIGIVVALCGALIVIRPGSDVFTLAALLPFCAAIALAGYAIVTRYIATAERPETALFYSGLIGALVFSVIAPLRWIAPDATGWALMAAMGLIGTGAQLLMIRAYMSAEASAVAPFSYAGLVSATLWGVLFFGDWPDLWTVVGGLVIVSAGLYVWHRETRHAARTAS